MKWTFLWSAGNGLGIRVVGGKEVPGSNGEIGAYVAKVLPGGAAEQTGKIVEGETLVMIGFPVKPCLFVCHWKLNFLVCF